MKLLALFSTITCAQGLYGSGDCDGENCEISVSMPALSFRLPGTANIQKELIRQREKFKLADNDRKRLRFEIIELRKSIEENRLESEKNSEEIKETIKNSFDEEINEKRKNLEEVFQTSMENFQLELKSSLVESVGKFGNDSTLLAKSLVSMTSMIDIVTRDFQKYLDDFHEKISSSNFTNSCPEPSKTEPIPASEPLKYSSSSQQAQVKIDSENSGASILKCYQCCEEIPITNDMIARLLGVQMPDDSSLMQENGPISSPANNATVTTQSLTTSTPSSSLSTTSSSTTSTSMDTKSIISSTSQSIQNTTTSKMEILDNAVTSIETAAVDVSAPLDTTTIANSDKNNEERALKASPPKQPFEKICIDDCLSDCAEYKSSGFNKSGVYRIKLSVNRVIEVFCDMETDGGGWTTVQRRVNGAVDFNQPWDSYKNGFGDIEGDHWLGLENMYRLTREKSTLRIDLTDFLGNSRYAEYARVRVNSEKMFYQLMVWGKYSGTVQDSLQYSSAFDHNQKNFTTFDSDNDNYEKGNCAAHYKNGWWFDKCFAANLNGKFYHEPYENKMRDGIYWGKWPNKLDGKYMVFTYIDMKIRPENFKSEALRKP